MDFGHWGEAKKMDQMDSQQQKQQDSGASGNNASQHPHVPEGTQVTHQLEHPGVVCDICDTTICGFRYKCMQCPDFDLCSNCERRGLHAGHVMMRIAFPEQAADAIKRFLGPSPSSPLARTYPPVNLLSGFAPAGVPRMFGKYCSPEGGRHHHHHSKGKGEKPHGRHGKKRHSSSSSENENEGGEDKDKTPNTTTPTTPQADCPYLSGGDKKRMHRWLKKMRKEQQRFRHSAESYAKAATENPSSTQNAGAGNSRSGFDFSAAATQIQDFLNAVGIPIDVVDFYEELNKPADKSGTTQQQTTSTSDATTSSASAAPTNTTTTTRQEQAGLVDQLEHLNIGNGDNNNGLAAFAALAREEQQVSGNHENQNVSKKVTFSTNGMDINQQDETEWTILDDDKTNTEGVQAASLNDNDGIRVTASGLDDGIRVSAVPEVSTTTNAGVDDVSRQWASLANFASSLEQQPSIPINVTMNVHGANKNSTTTTTASGTPLPSAPPPSTTTTTTNPTAPIYPQLPPMLQPQKMMSNLTNAIGSVMRNIPVSTPQAFGIPPPQQQPTTTTTTATQAEMPQAQLDARSVLTLNQLLSMGFSNHDGWLARLVASKNGDLDAVLSALFPTSE